MSFGKRGPGERAWHNQSDKPAKTAKVSSSAPVAPAQSADFGPDDDAYERIASKQRKRSEGASKMWTATFIIVAIVGVMLTINMTVSMSVASLFNGGSDVETEDGMPAGVEPGEADRLDKALARTCQPPNAARIAKFSMFPTNFIWLSGTRYGGGMKLYHAPGYFECIMKTEPKRFCHGFYREQLARQLKSYVRKIKSAKAYENAMANDPMRNSMKEMFEEIASQIQTKSGGSIRRNVIPDGVDTRISDGMISLSRKGLLSKGDFGWFGIGLPLDLKPYIAPQSEESPC